MGSHLDRVREEFSRAAQDLRAAAEAIEVAAEDISSDDLDSLEATFSTAQEAHVAAKAKFDKAEAVAQAMKVAIPEDKGGVEFKKLEGQREPLTYRKDNQHETSFFRDLAAAKINFDSGAAERLARHSREQYDLSTQVTGAASELVAPTYLQEQFAEAKVGGRPFTNWYGTMSLPPNTNSITVPTMTTGTAVAIQGQNTNENTAVQETDIATSSATGAVQTIAGMQDVSVQLLDRGVPGIDQIVFSDLTKRYNAKFETDVIGANQTNYKGLLNVGGSLNTDTITTTTVSSLISKIHGLNSAIQDDVFVPADFILMAPRRWAAVCAAADTTNRPLIAPVAPQNNAGTFGLGAEGVVGSIAGIPVIVSPHVPTTLGSSTNEDRVILGVKGEGLIYEDQSGPHLGVFPDVGSGTLTVRFRLHGYSALLWTRRTAAYGVLTSTGLVTPTF